MIEPLPCSIIEGTSAAMSNSGARTFTASSSSMRAASVSTVARPSRGRRVVHEDVDGAERIERLPGDVGWCVRITQVRVMTTGSCTSVRASAMRSSRLRATNATRAPASSSARAVAAPIPRDAPVTTAVRPSNEKRSAMLGQPLAHGRTFAMHVAKAAARSGSDMASTLDTDPVAARPRSGLVKVPGVRRAVLGPVLDVMDVTDAASAAREPAGAVAMAGSAVRPTSSDARCDEDAERVTRGIGEDVERLDGVVEAVEQDTRAERSRSLVLIDQLVDGRDAEVQVQLLGDTVVRPRRRRQVVDLLEREPRRRPPGRSGQASPVLRGLVLLGDGARRRAGTHNPGAVGRTPPDHDSRSASSDHRTQPREGLGHRPSIATDRCHRRARWQSLRTPGRRDTRSHARLPACPSTTDAARAARRAPPGSDAPTTSSVSSCSERELRC